jgi:hypothetical protein
MLLQQLAQPAHVARRAGMLQRPQLYHHAAVEVVDPTKITIVPRRY